VANREGEEYVNAWLEKKRIPHSLNDFWSYRNVCAEHGATLLDLFKSESALPPSARVLVAYGVFNGKLNAQQKREAVGLFLELIKQCPGAMFMDVVILNGFGKSVHPDYVHDIGKMTSDARYVGLWPTLIEVLYWIGTPQAIEYIKTAAHGPFTAACALNNLARLRVDGTLALCEEALDRKEIQYKDAIRKTYSKLKRQLAKRQASPVHVTKDAIPPNLTEWSANLDSPEIPKALRCVQKCCEAEFTKEEISEIRSICDDLSPEQTVRFKFEVVFSGKKKNLWIEIFCDDETAHDLHIFSEAELIERIEKALDKIL
jgi:hypothetical protein